MVGCVYLDMSNDNDCRVHRLPDLESDGRDPHRKCMGYAADAFRSGENPFDMCDCVTPEALLSYLRDE